MPSRDRALATGLGLVSAVLYALVPFVGPRKWDALMTASVLARPDEVGVAERFFFAHPLVIPLTQPFAFIVGVEPAARVREAFFGGVVVAIAYLIVRATTGERRAGVLAALGLVFAHGRYVLATGGEEKEVALAFGGTFLALWLDHRGALALGFREALGPPRSAIVLGLLLALACAVHLVNGLLVLLVLTDAILAPDRRPALPGTTRLLGVAALLAGPFFVGLAVACGARTPAEVVAHYLEYHLSGEFVSVPSTFAERARAAYGGARAYVLADPNATLVEVWLVPTVAVGLALRAVRVAPAVALRVLGLVVLLTLHFFFYEPWDPEAWGPASLAWAVLLATGLLSGERAEPLRYALGAAFVALALGVTVSARVEGAREASVAARALHSIDVLPDPEAAIARHVDSRLPPDAILVVSERSSASYFHVLTDRAPVVRDYLDLPHEVLRDELLLSALSLRFYTPRITGAQLSRAFEAGRPVYLLTSEPEDVLEAPEELGWLGLRVGRWDPRPFLEAR